MEIDYGKPEPDETSRAELRAREYSGSTARVPGISRYILNNEAACVNVD